MLYTVTIGLISEIGHASDKGCPYAEIFLTGRTYVRLFMSLSKTLASNKLD